MEAELINFKDSLLEKYNYNEKELNIIIKVVIACIETYGIDKKDIIFTSLLNTPVLSSGSDENVFDKLKEIGNLEDHCGKIVDNSALKISAGVYSCIPDITYDEFTKSFKISKVNRAIVIRGDLEENVSTLVHEMGHLFKSFDSEHVIIDDKLYSRSGIIYTIQKLSKDEFGVKKELISEKGVGIEEGINTYDEINICKKYFDPNYKNNGYYITTHLSTLLASDLGLIDTIHNAQFFANKDLLVSKYNTVCEQDLYSSLEEKMDNIYRADLKSYMSIFDKEKIKEINKRTHVIANSVIDDLKVYNEKKNSNFTY